MLQLRWTDEPHQQWVYQARASASNAWPVKADCTTSAQGRLLRRSFPAESLERVQGYQTTPAFAKAMRKRSIWVEGLFAEAKQWPGLDRFRLRQLANVNLQALLIAAGQNLKRWLGRTGLAGSRVHPAPSAWLNLGLLLRAVATLSSQARWMIGGPPLKRPFSPRPVQLCLTIRYGPQ